MLRPSNISPLWPRLKPYAEKYIVDGNPETADNIRKKCIRKEALCFASDEGVVILSLAPNRTGTGFDLWVLLAVRWGGPGAVKKYTPWLLRTARELSASRIVFVTIRRGWLKILCPGWRRESDKYVLEV